MTMLIAAALFFLLLHLAVAGSRVRDVIVGAIGEQPYLGLFSLASLGGIAWLAIAYNAAGRQGPSVVWDLGPGIAHLGVIVVGLAFLLGVSGLLVANPTAVMQDDQAKREDVVRGVLRITRHPFLWGVALWAAFHLAANGDEASIVFFGTFLVLAIAGTFSIDAKRQRKLGAAWAPFATATSNVPFAAIIAGRTSLKLSELMTYRPVVALLAFLAVIFAHRWLFGVSPFPGP